jgi:lysophospholipase L1-like esterase
MPSSPAKVMLIGDSMAYTAALGLAPRASEWSFTVANEGIMGCGVVRGGPFRYFGLQRDAEARCEAWPAAWQDALARNHPDLVGIVVGRWELMDRIHDGRWTNLFDPAFAAYLDSEIDTAVTLAQSGARSVVVFTTPYYRRGTTPAGGLFPEDDPARVDAINGILRRVAERHGLAVVDVGGWLSPEGKYTDDVGGVKVRSDGVHLTRQTGELLAPWLFPQLQTVLAG